MGKGISVLVYRTSNVRWQCDVTSKQVNPPQGRLKGTQNLMERTVLLYLVPMATPCLEVYVQFWAPMFKKVE